jgi:putative NADH-flavin reductase
MQLAIFGATGTVGSELVSQALAAGHHVRALVRNVSKLGRDDPHLDFVCGDVMDPAAVAQTIGGTEAVLSTLGATATDHPHTRRTGTKNIINAMHDSDVDRLVVMGGFHVHVPGEDGNVGQKLVVPFLHLSRVVVADTTGIGAVVVVLASDLDWTFVRSPRVVAGGPTGTSRTGTLTLGPWSKATRGDVAQLMLCCASKRVYVRQAPMVSS